MKLFDQRSQAPGDMRTTELLLLFACFFGLGLFNSSTIQENNITIATLQITFSTASIYYLRGSLSRLASYASVAALTALSLIISNGLAQYDAIETSDWSRVIGACAHMAFGAFCAAWFMSRRWAINCFVNAILAATIFYLVALAVRWISTEDPYAYPWFHAPPLFNHIRHAGYFLCVGVIVSSWGALQYRGVQGRLALAAYVVALSILLWSGGRGAFLAALVGLFALSLHFSPRRHARGWGTLLVGTVLALALSAHFDIGQRSMGWLGAFERSATAASLDQLSTSRLTIWSHLLPYIAERPLLGWGGEGFLAVWTKGGAVQAHNGLLQLLIEWGAIGALLVLLSLGWLTTKGLRMYCAQLGHGKMPAELVLGVALTMGLWALSIVDGVFYHGTPMAFMMAGFGMIFAAIERSESVGE
ncbi:O-antigen ligase family protein [Thauera mechernichensis]|uniref:O-antigen ligase family protein n=1 Tax=Thauera mechernichensis TaxID=82788 RepID=A0ABW3WBM2_9RHOO|nr:O-antigen ligase family protein [Thauera mechernichensis]MDG3065709.1 O-antigen ligase family protein [Thauera mechernichensis]